METIELTAPGGARLDKLIADGAELSRSAAGPRRGQGDGGGIGAGGALRRRQGERPDRTSQARPQEDVRHP